MYGNDLPCVRATSGFLKRKTGTTLAVFAAMLVYCSGNITHAKFDLKQYSKILVRTQTEDTNVEFHSIYLYDHAGKLVRLIEMWNGGWGRPPAAEEYTISNGKAVYVRSFVIENTTRQMVRDVLCKELPVLKLKQAPETEPDEPEILKQEAVPFEGCR